MPVAPEILEFILTLAFSLLIKVIIIPIIVGLMFVLIIIIFPRHISDGSIIIINITNTIILFRVGQDMNNVKAVKLSPLWKLIQKYHHYHFLIYFILS